MNFLAQKHLSIVKMLQHFGKQLSFVLFHCWIGIPLHTYMPYGPIFSYIDIQSSLVSGVAMFLHTMKVKDTPSGMQSTTGTGMYQIQRRALSFVIYVQDHTVLTRVLMSYF